MLEDIALTLRSRGLVAEEPKFDEPLSQHSTLKIGGPADLFLCPISAAGAASAMLLCKKSGVRYLVIGKGSNLLFADEGFRGAVISTERISDIKRETDTILAADCGAALSSLAAKAKNLGLSGAEFAYGIPGSVGGALYMNAGAYGGEIKDICISADFIDETGALKRLSREKMKFGYRTSAFSEMNGIILRAYFEFTPCGRDIIESRMANNMTARKQKQPYELPSAGSAFKRPQGAFAAALIEKAGLKGERVGGAAVSEKHAGFIVNLGGATAADVLSLMEKITDKVKKEFGVTLEPEIKYISN